MSGGAAAGGAAAAAAAAEQQRRQREEEEEMTAYGPGDLDGWEFKILRSATGKFKDSTALRGFLDEEAQNGWELVEKFDDSRIRLKRRVDARERDRGSIVDPYRTWVGITPNRLGLMIVGVIFGLILLGILVAVAVSQ
jgi:hypothetical protein